MKIKIDGTHVASVRSNREIAVSVAPGVHIVVAQMDWATSHPLKVTVAEGEVVTMRTRLAISSSFAVFTRPKGSVDLEVVERADD